MKRKVLAMLLIVAMIAFTGCSGTQGNYWKEVKKVAAWEATETEQTGNIIVQLGTEQVKIGFQTKGYINQKTLSGYIDMTMEMEMPASLTGTGKAEKMPLKMEMYMDEGKVYISKDYFVQAFTMAGEPVPVALTALDAAYIGVTESNEIATNLMNVMGDKVQGEKLFKFYEEIGSLLDLQIPVEKKDNTYTFNLNKEQIVKLIKSTLENGIVHLEKINTQYKLGLTQEEVVGIQSDYKLQKQQIIEAIDEYATLVDGNIVWTSTFDTNKETDKMTLTLTPSKDAEPLATAMFGGKVSIEVSLQQIATQVTPKEIKLPKVVELSEQQLNELLGEMNQ